MKKPNIQGWGPSRKSFKCNARRSPARDCVINISTWVSWRLSRIFVQKCICAIFNMDNHYINSGLAKERSKQIRVLLAGVDGRNVTRAISVFLSIWFWFFSVLGISRLILSFSFGIVISISVKNLKNCWSQPLSWHQYVHLLNQRAVLFFFDCYLFKF